MMRWASSGLVFALLVPVFAQPRPVGPGGDGPQPGSGSNPRPIRPVFTQTGPPKLDRHGDPLPAGAVARYGTVRLRHGINIQAMAFSSDAKLLCSVSDSEDTVKLWDTGTGKEVARVHSTAHLVGLANNGSAVLIDDTKVKVWLPTPNVTRDLPEKTLPEGATPTALAVNPDSKSCAVAVGGKVLLIDLQTGKALRELSLPLPVMNNGNNGNNRNRVPGNVPNGDPPGQVEVAAHPTKLLYSPDGKWLAGSGPRTGVWLWDLRTGKRVRTYRTEADQPEYAFSPDVTKIAVTGQQLHLYPLDAEEPVEGFKGAENVPLMALRFSADGMTIYAVQNDGSIRPYATETGDGQDSLEPPNENLRQPFALAPQGALVAAVDETGGICIWDPKTGKGPEVARLPSLFEAAFAPDGKSVTVLAGTNEVHTFDPTTGAAGKAVELDIPDEGLPTTWDARSRRVAMFTSNGEELEARFIDADTKKVISKHELPPDSGLPFVSFASANRDRAALFCQTVIVVVNPTNGRTVRTINPNQPGNPIRGAISPDGRLVAGTAGGVTVWEVATGKKRFGFEAVQNADRVVFSPDGRFLAANETSGAISIFDMRTGASVRKIQNAETADAISALAFGPDAKRLAVGFVMGRVSVWDVSTGDLLAPFAGHDGMVTSVSFSADGTRLVSSAADGTAVVWEVPEKPQPAGSAAAAVTGFDEAFRLLGATDAAQAQRGLDYLYRRPSEAVKQVGDRIVPPASVPAAKLKQYVADLESEDFRTREAATAALEKAGGEAGPLLRAAVEKSTSAEVRKLANELLGKLEAPAVKPDDLRVLRSIEVLEGLNAPDARALLEKWASGPSGLRITVEAAAALDRLKATGGK